MKNLHRCNSLEKVSKYQETKKKNIATVARALKPYNLTIEGNRRSVFREHKKYWKSYKC